MTFEMNVLGKKEEAQRDARSQLPLFSLRLETKRNEKRERLTDDA